MQWVEGGTVGRGKGGRMPPVNNRTDVRSKEKRSDGQVRGNYDTGHSETVEDWEAVNTRCADGACIYGDGVTRPAAGQT